MGKSGVVLSHGDFRGGAGQAFTADCSVWPWGPGEAPETDLTGRPAPGSGGPAAPGASWEASCPHQGTRGHRTPQSSRDEATGEQVP